jgi:acyl dehydratase
MTQTFRHYEDFRVGDVIDLGKKTVSRQEIIAFAAKYDPQPMHLDDKAGETSLLGGLAASGWQTCALTMRLLVDAVLGAAHSLGTLGIDRQTWKRPVRPGDTLSATATIREMRRSQSLDQVGLVRFEIVTSNQAGEVVMEMDPLIMIRAREAL